MSAKRLFPLLLLPAFFFAGRCPAAQTQGAGAYESIFAFGQRYVDAGDYARRHAMTFRRNGSQGVIVNGKLTLTLADKKREACCNGIKVFLSYPAHLRGGKLYISSVDVVSVCNVLLRPYSVPRHNRGIVTLDPGHGGKDRGCESGGVRESAVTLKTALKCAAILRKRGFTVLLTRSGDRFVSLDERVDFARKNKSQLFISIHVNAAADRSVGGVESFCLAPAGAPSSNGGKAVVKSSPGNKFDRNNLFLAAQLHRNLLFRSGGPDRGLKRARFVVIRDAACPAALLEIGFATNRTDAAKLSSDAYLDKIAMGIADGVSSYFRQLKK